MSSQEHHDLIVEELYLQLFPEYAAMFKFVDYGFRCGLTVGEIDLFGIKGDNLEGLLRSEDFLVFQGKDIDLYEIKCSNGRLHARDQLKRCIDFFQLKNAKGFYVNQFMKDEKTGLYVPERII